MRHALIQAVIERRQIADEARQRYDDASAGVDQDPLHNAKARLEAADALTDAIYELIHWTNNLLEQVAKDNGGIAIEDLAWLLKDEDPGELDALLAKISDAVKDGAK